MYISSYEEKLRECFDKALGELSATQEAQLTKVIDEIYTRVIEPVRATAKDYFVSNIADDLCREATRLAERMIEDALAGKDEQILNLFGFSDYGKAHYSTSFGHPREWNLIKAIVDKRPDIFVNEKIAQQEAEIAALRKDLARKADYCDKYHNSNDSSF